MATFQDCSIGFTGATSGESAYKTYTTVSRWVEFNDESLDWKKNVKQGKGLRVGGRVARTGRRQVPTAAGDGDFTMEIVNKGMGLLWQAAMGSATSTIIAATTAYQQNFTLGDAPPSLSIQKGIPQVGQGSPDAYTFLGCMVDSFELTIPANDIPTVKFNFDIGDINTSAGGGTAYASPTMPTALTNFSGAQVTATLGGTLTVPTTTAKASIASGVAAGVRNFSLTVNNNLATDRYNFGASGRKAKPTVGLRTITGKMTVEYDSTTWSQNFLNDTSFPVIVDISGAQIGTSGRNEGLQIVLPDVRIDASLPNANQGGLVSVDYTFTVTDNLTAAQPIYLVASTADTAL